MSAADFIRRLTRELDQAGVPYMLAGGFASIFHGEPRTTADVDVVFHPDESGLRRLLDRLSDDRYYVDEEPAIDSIRTLTRFSVIEMATGWTADLVQRKSHPFSQSEFERRRLVTFLGMRVWMATAEDVVVSKLDSARRTGSERQLRDVAGVLAVKQGKLDLAYIERWVAELGLGEQWDRVTARDPDAS